MWDLRSLIRGWTCVPCIVRQILNHWTTSEVLRTDSLTPIWWILSHHSRFMPGATSSEKLSPLCGDLAPCLLHSVPYTSLLWFSALSIYMGPISSSIECELLSIVSSIFTSYVQCLVHRSTINVFLKTVEECKEHLSISLDSGFCYYDTSLESRRTVKLMPSKLIVSTTSLNLILRMTAVVSFCRLLLTERTEHVLFKWNMALSPIDKSN